MTGFFFGPRKVNLVVILMRKGFKMKIMRLCTVILLAVVVPLIYIVQASAGNVFKTVDEHGNVTYTDQPPANGKATKVQLGPVNTQKAVVPPAPPEPPEKSEDESEEVDYSSARITQPAENTTVPPGQLDVVVQIGLKPQLQAGHLVRLYHNDRRQGGATSTTTYSLTNLIRGEHQVRAEIIGSNGKIKARTQTVTFFVKRYHPKN